MPVASPPRVLSNVCTDRVQFSGTSLVKTPQEFYQVVSVGFKDAIRSLRSNQFDEGRNKALETVEKIKNIRNARIAYLIKTNPQNLKAPFKGDMATIFLSPHTRKVDYEALLEKIRDEGMDFLSLLDSTYIQPDPVYKTIIQFEHLENAKTQNIYTQPENNKKLQEHLLGVLKNLVSYLNS